MTPSGIKPVTFWLVAQCLKLRHCVPPFSTVPGQYYATYSILHQSFLDHCMVVTKPVDSSQVTFTKFRLGLEFWISTLVLTTSQDSVTVFPYLNN